MYGVAFGAKRIARARVGEFCDRADIARAQLGNGVEFFSAYEIKRPDVFHGIGVGVVNAHARFELAAADAQVVHFSDERIDCRFEDLGAERTFFVAGDTRYDIVFQIFCGQIVAFGGFGHILHDFVHEVDHAFVLQRAACHNGDYADFKNAFTNAVNGILFGKEAVFKVFFKQYVVAFGSGFHELVLHDVVFALIRFGNGNFLGARVRETVRLAGERVDVARHLAAFHDGNLNGGDFSFILVV